MSEHNTDIGPIEQLTLALARLTAWATTKDMDGRPADRKVRSWKGYQFKALKRLSDAGLLVDKPGARTLMLTEEGEKAADALLRDLGIEPPEVPVLNALDGKP